MTVAAVLATDDGALQRLDDPARIAEAFAAARGLVWVHVARIDDVDAEFLRSLGLHPLAIEDCLSPGYERPKIDDYGDYVFLTLHGVDYARSDEVVATTELDVFVGPSFVITSAVNTLPAVDHLFETPELHRRLLGRGAPLLAHGIVDALVDSVLPVLDRMGEVTDAIEEEALQRPHERLLEHIVHLKRSVLRLQRTTSPQRDLLYRISRGDVPHLGEASGMYFRDIYDHLVRIEDLTSGLRERADNAVTTYLSSVTVRQNESMRILTTVAAIFLPLTLLTGIYGMNFVNMPELDSRYGYFIVVGIIALAVAVGSWAMWLRYWLGAQRRRLARAVSYAVDPRIIRDAAAEAARLRDRLLETRHLVRTGRPPHVPEDDPAP